MQNTKLYPCLKCLLNGNYAQNKCEKRINVKRYGVKPNLKPSIMIVSRTLMSIKLTETANRKNMIAAVVLVS